MFFKVRYMPIERNQQKHGRKKICTNRNAPLIESRKKRRLEYCFGVSYIIFIKLLNRQIHSLKEKKKETQA